MSASIRSERAVPPTATIVRSGNSKTKFQYSESLGAVSRPSVLGIAPVKVWSAPRKGGPVLKLLERTVASLDQRLILLAPRPAFPDFSRTSNTIQCCIGGLSATCRSCAARFISKMARWDGTN